MSKRGVWWIQIEDSNFFLMDPSGVKRATGDIESLQEIAMLLNQPLVKP